MTELERQLTKALRELSAQYEREQKQQAERVEGLTEAGRAARKAGEAVGPGLQGARRDLAQITGGDAPGGAGAEAGARPGASTLGR